MLDKKCKVRVKEACHSEDIQPGTVYIAPPDYHMLIEDDFTITLNMDEKLNFSRPSIDVLFESAADVFRRNLIGILLTGGNSDGSRGLKKIFDKGGKTIVQRPEDAIASEMPSSALRLFKPHKILTLREVGLLLADINSIGIGV